MIEKAWVSVPVGIDAGRWTTREAERTVVVAVHTVVSGQRLLDVVGLIESDPRIQLVVTQAPDVFSGGVSELISASGALEIPWQQAIHERFDLALAAAHGGVSQLHAPAMVLPHGAGHGKQTPRASGGRAVPRSVYGLGAEHLIEAGRLIPASIVLSHEAQLDTLARQCPEATEIALVAGDPCYDVLRASLGLRDEYRAALGVPAGRELVLLTSTWGPHSLYGRHPDLPAKLLRELDPRRHQVAVMIHPATWFGHGRRQLKAWLHDERAAGLLLIDPDVDWRAVVVAADVVIGDHGSTTVYAASIEKPVLHTDIPVDELDSSSAQAFVGRSAPRLLRFQPIAPQLRWRPPDSWGTAVAARLTSRPGQSHRLLREEMYRLLRLSMPGRHRAIEPVPVPQLQGVRRHA